MFGYKFVVYKNCAGFPESALVKVTTKLDSEKIPYKLYEKDTLIKDVKGIKNNYKKILKVALKNMEMENRLDRLQSKLNNFTIDDLEKVIEGIENESI